MVAISFHRSQPFDPDNDIPDLSGQVYIVTGVSYSGVGGIGFGIVAHLLQHNAAKVIILSSREEPAVKAVQELKSWGDSSRVTWRSCDLKSLEQVDKLGKALREEEKRLDGLILNAGINFKDYSESKDGIDNHFQVNALSQLHLALLLLRNLQATSAIAKKPSRIVVMTSMMHRFSPWSTKFDSIGDLNKDIGATQLYCRSKLAQILLVREMARRMDDGQLGFLRLQDAPSDKRAILVNATHPGGVRTPNMEKFCNPDTWFGWLMRLTLRPFLVDPVTHGCRSGLFAATASKELLRGRGIHGQYITPDKHVSKPSGTAQNEKLQGNVWKLSLDLLEEKLGELDYEFEMVPYTDWLNSTTFLSSPPVTYSDYFNDISQYNVHLNVAEKAWAAWYAYMQNDVLATGIMSFAMHELVYFGRCIPWMIADQIPFFNKYKIQGQKLPTLAEQWACAKLVLLSHFTVELPQIWLFHPMAQFFGLQTSVPFPPLWKMVAQIALFFVLEDTWHYWFHRALHTPTLYKKVHKLHHQYSAPFGLAAEYASPIETMVLAFGAVGIPIIFCAITKDLHILTMYIWIIGRLFQAIDAHSGYEFPWSLHHFLPFWAGADHHDIHHEKFIGNYSSSFRWWDKLCNTESGSVTAQKRRQKKVASTKAE